MDGKAASRSRAGTEVPTVECRTFAHPDQPMADLAFYWPRIPFRSVVVYLHCKFCWPVVEPNVGSSCSRVLTGVGQCLLNNPIGRHFEGRRKRPRFAVDRQVHG